MALLVEHRVVQDFGGLQGRILVEHHRAKHGLLGFVAPGSLAPGVLAGTLRRRGGERRYGRHPRLVSSSWGFATRPPGDTSRSAGCPGTGEPDCAARRGIAWCS